MSKILEDIRVVDLTDHVFGPYCTMVLAAHGAEVIKVEPPWGNTYRIAGGAIMGGGCPGWHAVNLDKKGMAIDLKDPRGLEIVKKLVPLSDVVIQNFSPGVMERLGLGYDVLKELNPKIIYAALSGFGQTGPYSPRASFAGIAQAISGFSKQVGERVDPDGPPQGMGGPIGDLVPALFSAISVIAALRHRDRTGVGQMIDSAQADDMVAINSNVVSYSLTGLLPLEMERKYPMAWRLGGYIKVKDGWISVAGHRARAIDNLKQLLGLDDVSREDLSAYVADMTREEAVEALVKIGMAVGPVYSANDVIADPHFRARGMLVEVEHPKAGKMVSPNYPVQYSETTAEISSPSPLIGQHNREILTGLLYYSHEQVDELEKAGVLVTEKMDTSAIDKRHPRSALRT